ncbi:origin recognition complex, subunit 3 [Aspergillus campestris IBT 28561]|uniref:Origin recognition complex, subunit 3 n=1 Tax=Aspergillus campestris (strain IBT 28561) TaxID=1392248 RepID=A0A2I1DAZ8_ASPC2|nr:origin recognition complex, subunit 3 [Aspergillus campestris IBT 28561]PKY07040.1 origin recognition complex, subunit 3 [Aspergillus campestris IBT 28561]
MDPEMADADAPKDGSNTQGVYLYHPANVTKAPGERPSKRRKVLPEKQADNTTHPFVPLLDGDETAASVESRYNFYQTLWSEQETKIQGILNEADSGVLEEVLSFVRSTSPQTYGNCIPTALVTVGSNVSSLGRLLARLNDRLTTAGEGGVVALESGDAPNLKTTLKNIIRAAITNTEGNEGYQSFLTDRDGPRLLGYDLDVLGDYVKRKGVTKLVIAFQDSEAVDPNMLTDLLSLLSSWVDRIPFTLLFGISTSVELFEGRLLRSSVALLRGRYFKIHGASNCVDRIYENLQADENGQFWLGRNITATLFEKSTDAFQTPEAFSQTVKYAYMSHFFANPLATLLASDASPSLRQNKLCEAIRNVPSFRSFCEDHLDAGSSKYVRQLLEDDEYLYSQSLEHLRVGQQKMRYLFQAARTIHICLKHLGIAKDTSISDVSTRALSGELVDSPWVEEILTGLKMLDSTKLQELIAILPGSLAAHPDLGAIHEDLEYLLQEYKDVTPLRSEYDNHHSVLTSTVLRQSVKLSRRKAKLPDQDVDYTRIIDRFHALTGAFFAEALLNPQDLFLHEAFIIDMKNPLKEIFSPRPRYAIERALARPFDYLISTSNTSEARVSAKQPATAILYQLILESGALVNVHDLWQAFNAVFESDGDADCDERMVLTLFYRALSELKSFGMVKSSRKKLDHIAKTSWVGL